MKARKKPRPRYVANASLEKHRSRLRKALRKRAARKGKVVLARPPSKGMRLDPTRTLTLRKAFSAQIRRKFGLLKGRIIRLIVVEDALGLREQSHEPFQADQVRWSENVTGNAFCPTGEGGGQDNSCSSGKSEIPQTKKEIGERLDALLNKDGELDQARAAVAREKSAAEWRLHVHEMSNGKFGLFDNPGTQRTGQSHLVSSHSTKDEAEDAWRNKYHEYVSPHKDKLKALEKEARQLVPAYDLAANKWQEIDEWQEILNAFCATGEGGGIDPTCSPHGGGTEVHAAEVVGKGLKTDKEYGVAVDESGRVVGRSEGDTHGREGAVDFPESAKPLLRDPSSKLEFHHNHPGASDNNFSLGDMKVLADNPGLAVLHAHTHTGMSYRASVVAGKHEQLREEAQRLYQANRDLIVDKHFVNDDRPVTEERKIAAREEHRQLDQKVPEKLAAMGLIKYSATRRNTLNAFCPTGEGGGQDNSCPPGGGHGAAEHEHPAGSHIGHPGHLGGDIGHAFHIEGLHHVGGAMHGVGSVIAGLKLIGGKVGAKIAHIEHAVKNYIVDKIDRAVAKLPERAQKIVNGAFAVGRIGTKAAFVTYSAGQAFAEKVARERGATAEEARRLRGTLATADIAAAKPTVIAAGAAASFVPMATAGYLAYSTARNPLATARAAYSVIDKALGKVGLSKQLQRGGQARPSRAERRAAREERAATSGQAGSLALAQWHEIPILNADPDDAQRQDVFDALDAHGYDDWYIALFHAALGKGKSVQEAIELANQSYDENPADDSQPAEDDEEALFGANPEEQQTENAFCPTGEGGGVDPSCSPGGIPKTESSLQLPDKDGTVNLKPDLIGSTYSKTHVDYTVNPTRTELAKLLKDHTHLRGLADDNKVVVWPESWASHFSMFRALGGEASFVIEKVKDKIVLQTHGTPHGWGDDWINKHLYFKRLNPEQNRQSITEFTLNTRWKFHTSSQKVRAFQAWLRQQAAALLRGQSEDALWQRYIEAGFKKGAGRAFDDVRKSEAGQALMDEKLGAFWQGTREEFLRSAFAQPEAIEKVKLLAGRTFDDLDGITSDMSTRITRALTDGLVEGKGAQELARDLAGEVDIGRDRAELIARTEIIRSHAEGQLEAMENLGVEEVGVAVEWSTAGDEQVCFRCADMEGVVLKLEEAHGMIPRHPGCRCSFIPANTGEDDKDQTRSKSAIDAAIKDSQGGDDDWGPAIKIGKDRPESILNEWVEIENAFCPTGPGGGQDNSCGSGGGADNLLESEVQAISDWREHLQERGIVTRLTKETVPGGRLEHLHPGEIVVYRGRPPGSKSSSRVRGTSYTKSKKVAEKWAEGGKVEELRLTKDTPAMDVGKALRGIQSKSSHEKEVFVYNAFCPTGPGGGQNNSCGSGGKAPSIRRTQGVVPAYDDAKATAHLVEQLAKLDKGHNLVSLADLRDAHPSWSPDQFKSVVKRAAREGKISLSAKDRDVSEREREAAVRERDPVTGRRDQLLSHASIKK